MHQSSPGKQIRIIARTHVGMVRSNNEVFHGYSPNIYDHEWKYYDQSVIEPDYPPILLALADGMGGLEMGEEASRIAIESTRDFIFQEKGILLDQAGDPGNLFDELFKIINREILTFAKKQGKAGDIGTTLVISFLHNQRLEVYWIGDSRCYLYRDGKLKPVSKDHSYVQDLVDAGKITYEQAFYHPESNIITKYMGDPKNTPVPSHVSVALQDGDLVLMCSDGLSGMIQDVEIEDHLKKGDSLENTCQALIDHANEAGGVDNITVMMLTFGKVPAIVPAAPEQAPVQTIRNAFNPEPSESGNGMKATGRRRKGWLWILPVIAIAAALIFYFGYLKRVPAPTAVKPPQESAGQDSTVVDENPQES